MEFEEVSLIVSFPASTPHAEVRRGHEAYLFWIRLVGEPFIAVVVSALEGAS